MFQNPWRGREARNFTKNVPRSLDLKLSSEQIFSEFLDWVPLIMSTPVIRPSFKITVILMLLLFYSMCRHIAYQVVPLRIHLTREAYQLVTVKMNQKRNLAKLICTLEDFHQQPLTRI